MVIIICAWCKEKIKIRDCWKLLEHPGKIDDLINENDVISHGVCPECCASMHADMGETLTNATSDLLV